MKAIHQDDFYAIGHQLTSKKLLINDLLVDLQSHAYHTGVERGKEQAKATEAGTLPPVPCQTVYIGFNQATIKTGHMLNPAGDEVVTLTIADQGTEVRLAFPTITHASKVLHALLLPKDYVAGLNAEDVQHACSDAISVFEDQGHAYTEVAEYMREVLLAKLGAPPAPSTRTFDLDRMVQRFLSWPLPESVRPDDCAMSPDYPHRYGTSLLTADEAKAMLLHVIGESVPVERTAESDWQDGREEQSPELAAAIQAREEAISQVHGLKTQLRDLVAAAHPIINALAGPSHYIRELQATVKIDENNPIIVLAKLCAAYRKQEAHT